MDSFTIQLIPNSSSHLFPNITLSCFYNLLSGAGDFGGTMGRSNFRNFLPINVPKRYRGGKLMFLVEKLSKTTERYYLKPGLSSSITDIVETMNTLRQEGNKHSDNCIRIKVTRVTKKLMFIWPVKNLVQQFVIQTWDIYFGDVWKNLRILIVEKVPINQYLLTILFASIHSCFTLTL